jgi:hypothetical protein
VRVADPSPLHGRDNRHAGSELAFVGLHAKDSCVSPLEQCQYFGRGIGHRPLCHGFDRQALGGRAALVQGMLQAGRDNGACCIGDERYAFARLDSRQVSTALRAPGSRSGQAGPKVIYKIVANGIRAPAFAELRRAGKAQGLEAVSVEPIVDFRPHPRRQRLVVTGVVDDQESLWASQRSENAS